MNLKKQLLFAILAGASLCAQQAFSGGITIKNNYPSNIVDGKEQNTVKVQFTLNWVSGEQVKELIGASIADAITLGGVNLGALIEEGKPVQQVIMDRKLANVPLVLTIYPGKTESFDQVGVWLTNFSFDPADTVIKGWYNTEYTGSENWGKIHVPAHQHWNLEVYPVSAR